MEPEIAIASKCGQIQGSRPRQEDYVAGGPTPRGDYLFVLADGMGGYEGGDQASEEAVRAFCESMRQEADLEGALHAANNRLAALKAQGKMPPDAGCTLIGVLLQEGICRAISVGDSLLYGYSGENGLKLLNRLHNKGAELDAMARNGQITPEQARSAPQRHALTSAVMGGPIRCVDLIDSFPLHHGDRLVLASDGCLTLGRQGLEDILRATPVQGGDDPEKIAGDILGGVERARRPRQDNASVIVVQAMRAERESFPLDPLLARPPARKPSVFNLQALLCICLCCAVLALLSMFAYWSFTTAQNNVDTGGNGGTASGDPAQNNEDTGGNGGTASGEPAQNNGDTGGNGGITSSEKEQEISNFTIEQISEMAAASKIDELIKVAALANEYGIDKICPFRNDLQQDFQKRKDLCIKLINCSNRMHKEKRYNEDIIVKCLTALLLAPTYCEQMKNNPKKIDKLRARFIRIEESLQNVVDTPFPELLNATRSVLKKCNTDVPAE